MNQSSDEIFAKHIRDILSVDGQQFLRRTYQLTT